MIASDPNPETAYFELQSHFNQLQTFFLKIRKIKIIKSKPLYYHCKKKI